MLLKAIRIYNRYNCENTDTLKSGEVSLGDMNNCLVSREINQKISEKKLPGVKQSSIVK